MENISHSASIHRGSCLCRICAYSLAQEPFDLCYCHCANCQKLTGSAYASYGSIARPSFKWTSGSDNLIIFSPSSRTRRFSCKSCGAYLLTEHDDEPENVFISLGCLDTHIARSPEYHQFVGSKAHWVTIHDHLPVYKTWPE